MLRGKRHGPGTCMTVYQTLQVTNSLLKKSYSSLLLKTGLEIVTLGVESIRDTEIMGDEIRGEPPGHAAN